MRVLFLIPARGGSKGLPGKNLRLLGGIPLVGWAARACAAASRRLEGSGHRVVCSTDQPGIAEAAREWGAEAPFQRPSELASDTADSLDVARHALAWFQARGHAFSTIALVQPTTPLVAANDVLAAIVTCLRERTAVASVAASPHAAWAVRMDGEARLHFALDTAVPTRRQASPSLLEPNGAVYAAPAEWILSGRRFLESGATLGLEMPASRSIDVDALDDVHRCEGILAGRPVRPVPIGDRRVGPGQPCFVIAEGGVNHGGDVEKAVRLIEAAADAGADAIKFQTFDPLRLASAEAPLAEYQKATAFSSQREMLQKLVLPHAAYPALQARARARGLVFLSSPFDEGSADFLNGLGLPALKLASGELVNHALLTHVARYRRPLIISTGMARMSEVAAAVDCVGDSAPVMLLHCVSSYPASVADANLRAMLTLRQAFQVPVGWSDHMPGIEVALAAAALGANVVEKHLTLDRHSSGPDHAASTEPADFRRMVDALRAVESALGDGRKVPAASESAIASVARKSLHWRQSLPAGTVVASGHLVALRPGTGISPAQAPRLLGRLTRDSVTEGAAVRESDLED